MDYYSTKPHFQLNKVNKKDSAGLYPGYRHSRQQVDSYPDHPRVHLSTPLHNSTVISGNNQNCGAEGYVGNIERLIDNNNNQVVHPTLRYNEVSSDVLFQKRKNRASYLAEYLSPVERSRKRKPSNTYSPKGHKLAKHTPVGQYMHLLSEPSMDSDTLNQALQSSVVGDRQAEQWNPGASVYHVLNQGTPQPAQGWRAGENSLHPLHGVIPPEYQVCNITVVRTLTGYQISAPDGVSLTDDDIKNVITAASTGQVIFKAKPQEPAPQTVIQRHSPDPDQSHSCSSFNSDATMGASSSACTGSSHLMDGSSQESLARSGPSFTMEDIRNRDSENADYSDNNNKQLNLDVGEEIVLETGEEVVLETTEEDEYNNRGPVPSVASVSVVSTSDDNSRNTSSSQ